MAYLVVEDEEAERLAAEIAKETGQSIGAAVTEALRERAERIQKLQDRPGIDKIMAAADRISSRITEPAIDPTAEFYDEHGLPR